MNDLSCKCPDEEELTDSVSTGEELSKSSVGLVLEEQYFDFGKVLVGAKAHKTFTLTNCFQHANTYVVLRNPDVNPIYHMFDFVYTSRVEPGKKFECKITYTPQIELETHVDYLLINDGTSNTHKLILRGESLGPHVQLSTNYLTFKCSPKKRSAKHTVELKNVSNFAIKYQFDVSENQFGCFELDKLSGEIGPNKQAYFTITFMPKRIGIYSDRLECLILHHKPCILNLVGLLTEENQDIAKEIQLRYYPEDISYRNGYDGYLRDSQRITQHPPPFTLSMNYIDFGSVAVDGRTLVTCLTNHMKEPINVIWTKDVLKIFRITPVNITIPPNDSVLYVCEFIPKEADTFYCKTIRGRVFWIPEKDTEEECQYTIVPMCVTLRLIGNSFPLNRKWIPQIEVPEKVTLPPCMPNYSSNATFLLRTTGYLPVSFRFLSPKNSKFIVKPMVGVVKTFAIIVVQLEADSENKKAYIERWDVELNGNACNYLPIFIKAYSEIPFIEIGKRNVVAFDNIYPGCEEVSLVNIRNKSAHHVRYKFREKPNLLQINHVEGNIAPNEQIQLEWKTTGRLKGPRKFKIWCEIYSVQNQVISGHPLEIAVKVRAECWFSQLCCIPNHWELEEVKMDSKLSKKFTLFNFGPSTIHYQIEQVEKTLRFAHENLTVVPSQGTLKPKEKKPLLVCLKVNQIGKFRIKVAYQVRINRESSEIVDMNSYKLLYMIFFCQNPTIKIEDILDCNFSYLFGKIYLAEQMCIQKINAALRNIKFGEVKTVNITLPDYEVSKNIFYVFLILKNKSKFETHVELKRNKICVCPLVQKPKGLTFTSKVYQCKHREMFKMNLSANSFEPNSYQKLTIKVRYLEVGPVNMSYALYLPQNRTLILNIAYNVLPSNVDRPSKYKTSFELNLGTVCVCEKRPSLKTFSFYNNSANKVTYSFKIFKITRPIQKYGKPQLECLNPKGALSPYIFHKLLFRFQPIKIKTYNYEIPLKMGHDEHVMHIFGRGVEKISNKQPLKMRPLLHSSQRIFKPETPIVLSQLHISCNKIPIWSSLEKLIFIQNISEDKVIGFSFQRFTLENCIEAKVLYSKGVLKPHEFCAVRILVSSFGQPCRTRLQIPCKFLDHTQYHLHKQSLIAYNLREEEIRNFFTITEKGTTYPKNDITVIPMPTNFYRIVTIDVHSVSLSDIDLHLDVNDQMKHSPQDYIEINSNKILKTFVPPLLSIDKPLSTFAIDAMLKKMKKENVADEVKLSCENLNVIKDTLQCLIAQVLNSNLFKKAMESVDKYDPPYYAQFKPRQTEDEKFTDEYQKKIKTAKEFINPVPTTTVATILKELLADSVHEIFKLGSQFKNTDVCYTYNEKFKLKTKFPCIMQRCLMDK